MKKLTLPQLASEINRSLHVAGQVWTMALDRARTTGHLLAAAHEKALEEHCWGRWLRDNVVSVDPKSGEKTPMSVRTASHYIRMAERAGAFPLTTTIREVVRTLAHEDEFGHDPEEDYDEDDPLSATVADIADSREEIPAGETVTATAALAGAGKPAKAPGKPSVAPPVVDDPPAPGRRRTAACKAEEAERNAERLARADEHFRRGIVRCRAVGLDWDAVTARFAEWVERVRAVEAEKEEAAETVEV